MKKLVFKSSVLERVKLIVIVFFLALIAVILKEGTLNIGVYLTFPLIVVVYGFIQLLKKFVSQVTIDSQNKLLLLQINLENEEVSLPFEQLKATVQKKMG